MTKYLMDTNTLVSFLSDRNPGQQERMARYFERAVSLQGELFLCETVMMEFVYVMLHVYAVEAHRVREMLASLLETPGIQMLAGHDPGGILDLWPVSIPDFGDAAIALHARSAPMPLLTFDRKLVARLRRLKIDALIP